MGGHSDPAVTQPISTDQLLAEKLRQIIGVLQVCLAGDFQRLFGMPLPSQFEALLHLEDYDLISTQTGVGAIVAEYGTGAASVVRTHIADPTLQAAAFAVVQSVLDFVQRQGGIAVGGYAASALVDSGSTWVSAVLCEVDFGNHQVWGTPVDFFIVSFAFVVWSPQTVQLSPDVSYGIRGSARFNLAACHWLPRQDAVEEA